MKILHVTNNYPTEDYPIFGIFVKEQIDSLARIGIENKVFFINGRELGKKAYWRSIFKLRKCLISEKFDLIHCHHVLSAMILILTLCSFRLKKIVSYQNDPAHEGGIFLYKIIHLLFNAIIFKNNNIKYASNKTFYIPNGVNINLFNPRSSSECKTKLNLLPGHNYILFMDSNNKKRTQKRIDRFRHTINILQQSGNPNNIEPIILTNTERNLIPYYMCASSLHLLSSDFEGSPNSVKEAMACNVPVVSTNVGNVDELLSGCVGSYVAKTKDPEELADLAYKALMSSAPLNSRKILIEKELDIESVAKKIALIYERVIAHE